MAIWPTATSATDAAWNPKMPVDPATVDPALAARRKRARRTALLCAVIAVAVYAAFFLSGAVGR